MYFDGSLRLQGAGAGILFIAPGGDQLKYALQLLFPAFNNATEYEALVHGLSITVSLSIKRLMVYDDSLVVIIQVNKDWDCSTHSMNRYCAAVQKLEVMFEGLEFSRAQAPSGFFCPRVTTAEHHHRADGGMPCSGSGRSRSQ
jgi:ribonuclease HI